MIFSHKSTLAREADETDGARHLQGGPPRGRLGLHRQRRVLGKLSHAFVGAARRAVAEQRQPGQSETIECAANMSSIRRPVALRVSTAFTVQSLLEGAWVSGTPWPAHGSLLCGSEDIR
jgi:hypothetical protein